MWALPRMDKDTTLLSCSCFLLQAATHSPWASEVVNRAQGRKIGPIPSISIGIQFTPFSQIAAPIMLSTLCPQCDPSSDELSANGPSLQGACVGQCVWNQLYKEGLSLFPSASSPAVLSCWDGESWEQLQGQLHC